MEKYGFEIAYQSYPVWWLNHVTPRIFHLLDGEKKTSILQGLERLRVVLSDAGRDHALQDFVLVWVPQERDLEIRIIRI